MQPHEAHAPIGQLLNATHQCTGMLLAVLEEENQALRQSDAPLIGQTAAAKHALIRELDSCRLAQDRFLSAHDLPAGSVGMERYLRTLPIEAPEHAGWSELRELWSRCQRQNEINGGIVTSMRQRVQQALDILKGSPETGPLYGRKGEALLAGRTNSLAKA